MGARIRQLMLCSTSVQSSEMCQMTKIKNIVSADAPLYSMSGECSDYLRFGYL